MAAGERTKRTTKTPVPLARLRVTVGAKAYEPDADTPVSVGSSPDNSIVVDDPTVSRYHLELARTSHGILVRDLGSSNGTYAGGVRLERAVVPPGTRLKIGDSVVALDDGAPLASRARAAGAAGPDVPGIVGVSDAIREVQRAIASVAASTSGASVLVQGETGTGKELVARAIHDLSPRRDRPFVVVDCGSLPPTLVASELFGHERGAFTGADKKYAGAFERADGGTVFLDEIGELPLAVQPSLLGVLERRRFRRVGGDRDVEIDVRVVSATHRDLRAEVNRGGFRADLYFRLAVARIVIPPLRERSIDIPALVAHFVQELTGSNDVSAHFGPATMQALAAHRWSGNVRELRNVVEAALTMGRVHLDPGASLSVSVSRSRSSLGVSKSTSRKPGAAAGVATDLPYRDARAEALAHFEAAYLRALMDKCANNASEAARLAKMDRPYLLSLLRRHGLR